jgi:hypothetical protein
LPVPLHGTLSGALVHALAVETGMQGRNAYGQASLIIVIAAFLLCFWAGSLWERVSRPALALAPIRPRPRSLI